MSNEPFVFKWGAFLIALAVLFIPLMTIYIKAKSNAEDENAKFLKKIAFFANNFLLYLLSLTGCMISLNPYYWYINSDKLSEFYKDLMGTGILLPFILWALGAIIRSLYKFVLKKCNTEDVLKESSKETVLTVSLLICMCLFSSVIDLKDDNVSKQFMFLFFILSVIIGKFVWLDTTREKLIKTIKRMWKLSKCSIILGVFALLIMFGMWTMPKYVAINTAVSFGIGLLVALLLLTGKAVYDFRNNK